MTDDDRVESESTSPCVTIAVAAVAAFVIGLIVADALGLVAVPAVSDLLDRLEKVVSILIGLLGFAGLVVMKRTSQVDLRAVRTGAVTGVIALLVCLPLFPSPHNGATPATMPTPSSLPAGPTPSPTREDLLTPPVRGRAAAPPATDGVAGERVGRGQTRGLDGAGGIGGAGGFRGSGGGSTTEPSESDRVITPGNDRPEPVPSKTTPSVSASPPDRTESTPSLVIRQSDPPMTVSVTAENLAEAAIGDFLIAPDSITPIAPASVSADCDPQNYQSTAVLLDAATQPVMICVRARAGLEVLLRLAPHPATYDETDRLLVKLAWPRASDGRLPPTT
ncbi:hypothetical protein [Actinoplanes solisilvae]|uniref:hypothetical protein n=1 Tax=Actinoplanes solisilvae TaxID=2486853 RepID=UPI000FD78766|nr:hypothetical protein [Actinoplanes solisilvae]